MSSQQVLITRPEPEARQLGLQLQQSGLNSIVSPALAFKPRASGINFDQFWKPATRKLAIFCSPRAVDFGLRHLPAGFLEGVEIAAIGPASADHLETAGLPADILAGPPFNSESLLRDADICSAPGQALLFTAPGGRQRLIQGLQELGWDVSFAYVYDSILVEVDPGVERQLMKSSSIISVWTSARALAHLSVSMAPEAWSKVSQGIFVVTSERLAEKARELCANDVVITPGPGNADIVTALLGLVVR